MNTVPSLRLPLQSRLVARFHSLFTIDFDLQSRDLCDAVSLHEDLVDLFERRTLDPPVRGSQQGDGHAAAGQLLGHPARPLDRYESEADRSDYVSLAAAEQAASAFQVSLS